VAPANVRVASCHNVAVASQTHFGRGRKGRPTRVDLDAIPLVGQVACPAQHDGARRSSLRTCRHAGRQATGPQLAATLRPSHLDHQRRGRVTEGRDAAIVTGAGTIASTGAGGGARRRALRGSQQQDCDGECLSVHE
jgi:hypothetical protein